MTDLRDQYEAVERAVCAQVPFAFSHVPHHVDRRWDAELDQSLATSPPIIRSATAGTRQNQDLPTPPGHGAPPGPVDVPSRRYRRPDSTPSGVIRFGVCRKFTSRFHKARRSFLVPTTLQTPS